MSLKLFFKKIRVAINDKLRYNICVYNEKNSNHIHKEIAEYFQKNFQIELEHSTIFKILKDKKKWLVITDNNCRLYFFLI